MNKKTTVQTEQVVDASIIYSLSDVEKEIANPQTEEFEDERDYVLLQISVAYDALGLVNDANRLREKANKLAVRRIGSRLEGLVRTLAELGQVNEAIAVVEASLVLMNSTELRFRENKIIEIVQALIHVQQYDKAIAMALEMSPGFFRDFCLQKLHEGLASIGQYYHLPEPTDDKWLPDAARMKVLALAGAAYHLAMAGRTDDAMPLLHKAERIATLHGENITTFSQVAVARVAFGEDAETVFSEDALARYSPRVQAMYDAYERTIDVLISQQKLTLATFFAVRIIFDLPDYSIHSSAAIGIKNISKIASAYLAAGNLEKGLTLINLVREGEPTTPSRYEEDGPLVTFHGRSSSLLDSLSTKHRTEAILSVATVLATANQTSDALMMFNESRSVWSLMLNLYKMDSIQQTDVEEKHVGYLTIEWALLMCRLVVAQARAGLAYDS